MTGVIKSGRCGTCRKRKVKCDEAKPVCGPCQKGGRTCENPISRVKFTKPKEFAETAAYQSGSCSNVQTAFHACSEIAVIRSKASDDGSSFQTMRIGGPKKPDRKRDAEQRAVVSRSPPLSAIESLQLILLETFSYANPGMRLSSIAGYVREIPPRLGHSSALDASIAALVNCYTVICHGSHPGDDRTQANLYTKAILSLQEALKDPVEGFSDNTLGAVTIMGQVEILGGGAQGPHGVNYINHAGGAARLIEVRGPSLCQSSFAKLLYMFQRGPSVMVATVRGEECFLDRPDWHSVSCTDVLSSPSEWMMDELERELTPLPGLLRRIRGFYLFPNEDARIDILKHAQQLRRAIQPITEFVTEKFESKVDIVEVPSACNDAMFPMVYSFASRALADVCASYWCMAIILDSITLRFLPFDSPPTAVGILVNRCMHARQQICMSYEYAQQYWPFGSMYIAGPLVMSYSSATAEEKIWIMHKLWKIGELIPGSRFFWGQAGLEVAAAHFSGEPLAVPEVQGNGEDGYKKSWEENLRRVRARLGTMEL